MSDSQFFRKYLDILNEELVGQELARISGGEFATKQDRLNQAKVDAVLGPGYKAGRADTNMALAQNFRQQAMPGVSQGAANDEIKQLAKLANTMRQPEPAVNTAKIDTAPADVVQNKSTSQPSSDYMPTKSTVTAKSIGFTGDTTKPTAPTFTGMAGKSQDSAAGTSSKPKNTDFDPTPSLPPVTVIAKRDDEPKKDKPKVWLDLKDIDQSWIPKHVDLNIKDRGVIGVDEPPSKEELDAENMELGYGTYRDGTPFWYRKGFPAYERDEYRRLRGFQRSGHSTADSLANSGAVRYIKQARDSYEKSIMAEKDPERYYELYLKGRMYDPTKLDPSDPRYIPLPGSSK